MRGVLSVDQVAHMPIQSLAEVLATVPDPRSAHGRRHSVGAILALSVCAMLCGARSLYAIAQWGRDHGPPMATALGFTRPMTPCVATLHHLFKRLDREALEAALGPWFMAQGLEPGAAIARDGKALRGIHGEEMPGVHLVAAYAHRAGVVLAQAGVGSKEAEATVAPNLLVPLDLQGCVVTGDAHFAQRALCRHIVAQGGDYLFALKGNQPTLREDVAYLFAEPPESFPETTQRGRHGDRWELRRLRASDALNDYSGWPHLGQVCRLDRTITRKGLTRWEVAYLITSLPPQRATPRRLLELARGHWRIENRLHYVRDVTLGEDASQVRCGAAPQVLAALRNTTIGLLRLAGTPNIAAALRRHSAHPAEALALLGLTYEN